MPPIAARTVTYDFHRMMDWGAATKLKCSTGGFGDAIIKQMGGAATSASKPAMAMA